MKKVEPIKRNVVHLSSSAANDDWLQTLLLVEAGKGDEYVDKSIWPMFYELPTEEELVKMVVNWHNNLTRKRAAIRKEVLKLERQLELAERGIL